MKLLLALVMLFCLFSTAANAYPEDQYNACMLAAKSNPAVINLPESAIADFCNCALTEILDKGKNDSLAAKECARKTLNN